MSGLNGRQDAFCRNYVSGMSGMHAAYRAGYSARSAANQGYRLLQRTDVQARIDSLRSVVAQRACLNSDALLAKLEAVYGRAMSCGEYGNASRIIALQARISGLDKPAMMRSDEK